jgi:hypothetical protein
MKERCKPPQFDEHDWSQLDFTRWNLDAVARDSVAKAVAGLATQFFSSPEWQESVTATLPELQKAAVAMFKGQAEILRTERSTTVKSFEKRTLHAKEQSAAMRRAIGAAAAPQTPTASANAYSVAVRVTSGDPPLGLPGLVVELADPRDEKSVLDSATTDDDGNATLTVADEVAKAVEKQDTAVRVVGPSGKILLNVPDGVCIRLNQVETKVLKVKDSPEIAPAKESAVENRAQREVLLKSFESRADTLSSAREARLANIDCRLNDIDATIEDLDNPPDLAKWFADLAPGPTPTPQPRPQDPAAPAGAASAATAPPRTTAAPRTPAAKDEKSAPPAASSPAKKAAKKKK